ncbi:hypothetical protein BDY24DRAFT_377959 [Mrakia frigida]|uniref:J-domain-containing protein n=1 Tax=Mrakia frigida TaxID=29902 RepID=UPI003FCBEF36
MLSTSLYRPHLSLQTRSLFNLSRAATSSSSEAQPPLSSPPPPPPSAPSPSPSPSSSSSAAAHLFALAEEEERTPPPPPSRLPPSILNPTERPWDGDEPLEQTVKRMISDSHKPIRSGKIRSAEEKLRDEMKQREVVGRMGSIPDVGKSLASPSSGIKRNTKVWDGHLVGGDPNHRPWHSEYVVPSHDRALIKRGVLLKPPPSLATSSSSSKPAHLPEDPSARAALRRSQKLKAGPVRLSSAREGALDYEFGGRKNKSAWLEDDGEDHLKRNSEKGMGKEEEGHGEEGGKLLEVRMGAGDEDLGAGWGSLVELRIERARAQGQFKNLSGAGKPLEEKADAVNPFLDRTEFLMNRVIQRNDALPAWIQYQQEHTASLDHLRKTLVQTLHRLLLLHPSLSLVSSVEDIAVLRVRDLDSGAVERKLFEGLVEEANRLVRRANGISPAPARRSITTLDIELSRAYPLAAAQVHKSLHAPPVLGLTDEELRRKMRAKPDPAIWSIAWPKRWVVWWAWLKGLLAFGRRRGGAGAPVRAVEATKTTREELGG